MKNVLIPTKLDSVAREILQANGFTVIEQPGVPLCELAAAYPDTGVIIVRSENVGAQIIDALPKLRLIVRAGAGYNTIDIKHARRKGVDVMNTPGANANAVAEEVFALVLAQYRHVVPADVSTRQGKWEKKKFMGRELRGKTLGIVGLGNIGQIVAKYASGFGMIVQGYDPLISTTRAEEIGVRLVDMPTIFATSDIVTLHVPETGETTKMVNRTLLERMKPGAVLVNCARAGIIDEDALRQLKHDKGIGFCTDVYPADAPGEKSVADLADVMLPHLGANTVEANENAARRAAEQILAYVERGVTRYVVNKGVPDGLDEAYQQLAYRVALLARHYLGVDKAIRCIECSFYGGLSQYSKWFLSPIIAGITPEFDVLEDPQDAEEYLQGRGIALDIRKTDESKRYGKSVTIDLLAGTKAIQQVSVRGTIAEGNLMISRIDVFDKLYVQPYGHNLFVVYRDRPGVLTKITGACADADINIDDIRAPRDATATMAMAVLRTNKAVPAHVVEQIRREIEPETVFAVSIPF